MNTFESLFVNYQPRLVTYADSIVKDHSIALDMVQDTFFTFWKKYSGQDEKSSARLLFAMTRNRCINYLKRERLLNYVDLLFLDSIQKTEKLFGLDFYYDAPDSPLIRKEVENQVEKVLSLLPDRCRGCPPEREAEQHSRRHPGAHPVNRPKQQQKYTRHKKVK